MTIQEKLELSVEHRGLSDHLTLILSRKRDLEIVAEQQAIYDRLKAEGRLRQMVREFKNPTRQQEIYETIRRVEEM